MEFRRFRDKNQDGFIDKQELKVITHKNIIISIHRYLT